MARARASNHRASAQRVHRANTAAVVDVYRDVIQTIRVLVVLRVTEIHVDVKSDAVLTMIVQQVNAAPIKACALHKVSA